MHKRKLNAQLEQSAKVPALHANSIPLSISTIKYIQIEDDWNFVVVVDVEFEARISPEGIFPIEFSLLEIYVNAWGSWTSFYIHKMLKTRTVI